MNIVEEIYQHVKRLPSDNALEVLNFITAIETENTLPATESADRNHQCPRRKVFTHRFVVDNVELPARNSLYQHPFFGMNQDEQETVEAVMNRLRGSRY